MTMAEPSGGKDSGKQKIDGVAFVFNFENTQSKIAMASAGQIL